MQEIGKFDAGVSVIPNRLEKYMVFTINNNLAFSDSMQFFSADLLELVKQKGVYPYEYMGSFEKFSEDKLPDIREFYSSLKDECACEKTIYLLLMFGIRLR